MRGCFLTCPLPVLSWAAVASARGTWGEQRGGRCPGPESVTCRTVTDAASPGPRDTAQGWTATACKPRGPRQGFAGTPIPEGRGLGGTGSPTAVRASSAGVQPRPRCPQVSGHAPAVGAEAREEYVRVVDAMGRKLRAVQYNGSYFDRGAKAAGRLCTPEGWFSCQVSCAPFPLGHPGARRACLPVQGREDILPSARWARPREGGRPPGVGSHSQGGEDGQPVAASPLRAVERLLGPPRASVQQSGRV